MPPSKFRRYVARLIFAAVALLLVGIGGCGGGSEPSRTLEESSFSLRGWPELPREFTDQALNSLTSEKVEIPKEIPMEDCEFELAVENEELKSDCGAGLITLSLGAKAAPEGTCAGSEADGFNCEADLEGISITAFAWKARRARQYVRDVLEQLIDVIENENSGSSEEAAPEDGKEPAVEAPVSYVGTITGSDGKGTTFTDRYSLGPLTYSDEGTPPEAVLNACHINEPGTTASSVFARGQVTTTYQEGSLPIPVILLSWEEVAQGGEFFLVTAFRLDGEWRCNSETEAGASVEFQPGESQTVPIWVIGPRVLTNAQPRLPTSVTNTWYFKFIGSINGYSRLAVTGPGAADCEEELGEEQRLMLFNRSGTC